MGFCVSTPLEQGPGCTPHIHTARLFRLEINSATLLPSFITSLATMAWGHSGGRYTTAFPNLVLAIQLWPPLSWLWGWEFTKCLSSPFIIFLGNYIYLKQKNAKWKIHSSYKMIQWYKIIRYRIHQRYHLSDRGRFACKTEHRHFALSYTFTWASAKNRLTFFCITGPSKSKLMPSVYEKYRYVFLLRDR